MMKTQQTEDVMNVYQEIESLIIKEVQDLSERYGDFGKSKCLVSMRNLSQLYSLASNDVIHGDSDKSEKILWNVFETVKRVKYACI